MNTFAIGSLPVHFSVAKLFTFRWQYTSVRSQLADALAVVGGITLFLVPVGAVLIQVHRPVLPFDLYHFIACFHAFLNMVTNITILFEKNNAPKQKNMLRSRLF